MSALSTTPRRTTAGRSPWRAGLLLVVPRVRSFSCLAIMILSVVGCQDISAQPITDVLAPPECRVHDEYGFGCHAKCLAGLEQQIRSVLEEIAAYNAAHHTSFEPKQSQAAWEAARQARCGATPSWNQSEPRVSFDRIECYMDVTDERFVELDTFVSELPP